jgi:predicted dehydrogenase
MLKVGMVDHHLNNWHADTFLRLLRGPLASEEVEIVAAWESDPIGEDWCEKNGVRRADSPEEAIRGMDAILLLAPDNIDRHFALAKAVLPFGKPTLIDKFLAPTLSEAQEIVALGKQYNTPLFSASSLRYAVELDSLMPEYQSSPITAGHFTGMGVWSGYGVHTLALALRVMGPDVQRVADTGLATDRTVTLDYGDGRRGVVDVREAQNGYEALGWTFTGKVGERYVGAKVADYDGFYTNLMRRTAGFFKTHTVDMPVEEALAVVAILEAADRSQNADGDWVHL